MLQPHNQPIRVLHIVENLDNQATENWLFKVLRVASEKHPHLRWTFFCISGEQGKLDNAVRQMGAEIIYSSYPIGDKKSFITSLRRVMKDGRYQILHSHHDIMSAVYLAASSGLPFRKRIVHVHNTELSLPTPSALKKSLYREPMRQLCLRYADRIIGASSDALSSIVGGNFNPERDSVIHCGIDTSVFEPKPTASARLRAELGLDEQSKVILFVGRMIKYKNPCFVIEILEPISKIDPDVVAVFAGAGSQEPEVLKLAKEKQLEDKVKVLGWRNDVPLLMSISNVLLFPSDEQPKEGLGLGVIEAQAAGLPVLVSGSVPEEAIILPEIVKRLSLEAGYQAWADLIVKIFNENYTDKKAALAEVESSSFSISQSAFNILNLYNQPKRDSMKSDEWFSSP